MTNRLINVLRFSGLAAFMAGAMPAAHAAGFDLLKSVGDALNNAVSGVNQSVSTDGGANTGSATVDGSLRDTPLNGILASGNEWPRVALTINNLPQWFYDYGQLTRKGRYGANDCITVSFTVWESAGKAKNYENMQFCGDDIVPDTPYGKLSIWSSFGSGQKTEHTGKQRTAGPLPPERLFPNKTGLDMFFSGHGSYYLGGIMATLGYNWNESSDYRFWVVDLPNQAQSKRGETIAAPAVRAAASSGEPGGGAQIAAKCTPRHFTQQKFDRISKGMTIDQVNQLIGCGFDPYFNQNDGNGKLRMWAADDNGLVAAYSIQVIFDKNGKAAGLDNMFKRASGF